MADRCENISGARQAMCLNGVSLLTCSPVEPPSDTTGPAATHRIVCTRTANDSSFTVITNDTTGRAVDADDPDSRRGRWIARCLQSDRGGGIALRFTSECVTPLLSTDTLRTLDAYARKESRSALVRDHTFPSGYEQIRHQRPGTISVVESATLYADVPMPLVLASLYAERFVITERNLFRADTWQSEIRRPEFRAAWKALAGTATPAADSPLAKTLAIGMRMRRTLDALRLNTVDVDTHVEKLSVNKLAAIWLAYHRPADLADAKALAEDPGEDSLGDDMGVRHLRNFTEWVEMFAPPRPAPQSPHASRD